ncbi:flagellar hook-length control protein FliK [Providencia vermicola]|uniref:flagellar hook-length control protein FliK n=1 Tax=Providencia vermicola TaxID=333965 RepID=UPI0034E48FD9
MDVNTHNAAKAAITNSKNIGNAQQNEPRFEDNQAPAVPFQAVLDNQQPAPQKTSTNHSTLENTPNSTSVSTNTPTAAAERDTSPIKDKTEHAIDQLNYSRHIRNEANQPALQAQLLNQADAVEQVWLTNLKSDLNQQALASVSTKFADGHRSALVPFAQKTSPFNSQLVANPDADESIDFRAQMQLAEDEESTSIAAFIKNEKQERKDQPLFSLNNKREISAKELTHDFMPLNKKLADKDPLSVTQNVSVVDNSQNIKGAFTSTVENGSFQVTPTQTVVGTTVNLAAPLVNSHAASANMPVVPMPSGVPLGSDAWQQQLNQHMLFFSRQGISHAQIRLHPEELGSLNVHLRIEDNQAVMHFVSPHSHVRAAMETMMPMLRNALQESGIHLAQGSVGQDNFSDQNGSDAHSQNSHEHQLHTRHSVGGIVNSDSVTATHITSIAHSRGGIDTFA